MKIYVPDLENYKCFVVRDETTIRAYKEIPQRNQEIEYRDYFYNSNYLYQDGVQSFGSYSTLPICLENNILTDDYFHRLDFNRILIIYLILFIFIIYIPLKIFMRFFKRRGA